MARLRLASLTVATLGLLAPVVSCAATPPEATTRSGGPAAVERAAAPQVTKLLVFVVENHSLKQMRQGMPWLDGLATTYGYANHYYGIRHPSLPNYLAIAGGDTFGVADDQPPSAHAIRKPSVLGEAIDAGATATTYAEGMSSRCELGDDGRYAVRHNPWTYFRTERGQCRTHDVRLKRLKRDVADGSLPNVGLVVPDVCHDAHDCGLAQADAWLRTKVGMVLDGSDFASGALAVVVTADEDDRHHGNRVLTVVAHPSLDGTVVTRNLTHYSLSRSLAQVAGVDPLGHAVKARSLLRAFGLA